MTKLTDHQIAERLRKNQLFVIEILTKQVDELRAENERLLAVAEAAEKALKLHKLPCDSVDNENCAACELLTQIRKWREGGGRE